MSVLESLDSTTIEASIAAHLDKAGITDKKVIDDITAVMVPFIRQAQEVQATLKGLTSLAELDALRVETLGKKSPFIAFMRTLGSLDAEIRPVVGAQANEVRQALEGWIENRKAELTNAELDKRIGEEKLDITLPGRARPIGSKHLISQIEDEIVEVFIGLGYQVAEGPEVELSFFNFDALNHSPQHPTRSVSDTFYVHDMSGEEFEGPEPSDVLMRTHTSPVQVRAMQERELPIYILAPGKTYRRDVADPTHLPQFTQIEGLVVDKGITFADLKGTLDYFVKAIFGPERRTRFRPHFFPFTEPSAEVDISCGICDGSGKIDGVTCRFCSGVGWVEILGCGMVDPNVFRAVDIDPEVYAGFAFGMGVERIALLRYDIPDIRMLIEGDMRFLRQF
ncbi:MAG: phenylalanine--tRNA ligase subunit alpha [Actinomycetia bacterium]|nr:phenylalanine--tRNA ligase subunit alpha [Actinomycetes bacterium]